MGVDGDASAIAQSLKEVTNTSWGETSMTYNTKPAFGSTLGTIYSNNQKYSWANSSNLTSFIASRVGNVITIAISHSSTDGITFYSRESSNKPVLVIQTTTAPTPTPTVAPTNTPTPTPTGSPTATPTPTPTPTPTLTVTPTPVPGSAAPVLCPACNFASYVSVGNRLSGHDFTNGFFPAIYGAGQNLSSSNFTGAAFNQATLTTTNMTNSNFTNADFTSADLTGASTTGATFTGATWSNTTCPDGTNSDADGGTCVGHL